MPPYKLFEGKLIARFYEAIQKHCIACYVLSLRMHGLREISQEISRPTVHRLALPKSSRIRVLQLTINRGEKIENWSRNLPAACHRIGNSGRHARDLSVPVV